MSSLSQALRLEDLPSSHDAFQGHAAHIIEWPTMLRPKDSEGTCIPSGVTTFLQSASRRSPPTDHSPALGGEPRVTSTEEPDGGNLLVRIWRGAGVGNLPAYS